MQKMHCIEPFKLLSLLMLFHGHPSMCRKQLSYDIELSLSLSPNPYPSPSPNPNPNPVHEDEDEEEDDS